VRRSPGERFPGEFGGVLDEPDCHDGVRTQVRPDDQRLVLVIADGSDASRPVQIGDIMLELRPELRVLYVVNESDKAAGLFDGEAAATRSEVGMVVLSVEQIVDTVRPRYDAEEPSHRSKPPLTGIGPASTRSPRHRQETGRCRFPASVLLGSRS